MRPRARPTCRLCGGWPHPRAQPCHWRSRCSCSSGDWRCAPGCRRSSSPDCRSGWERRRWGQESSSASWARLPLPAVFSPYLMVVAAVAMVGGGAAALATRSPRARLAYLAAGQVGWVAAGLATHYRVGVGASLFLLGAFALAATTGPALMAGADVGEFALAGMGLLRPARAAGIALVFLSLAGAPPLAGFFGEFAVAATLAQTGNLWLLALGLLGALMSMAAVVGTLRAIFLQSPPDDSRRAAGARLPVLTRLSTYGAVALCVAIAGYGVVANPILTLADQGAEALGLR